MESEELEGCPVLSWEIAEKTHVWRLICISYAIMNDGQHLMYNTYNKEEGKRRREELPPFNYSDYLHVLKKLQEDISHSPELIKTLLHWHPI